MSAGDQLGAGNLQEILQVWALNAARPAKLPAKAPAAPPAGPQFINHFFGDLGLDL
ncbi:hypothetical protein ABBQ38_004360 [Trebouxia sp. C0009 RCD-2024]